MNPLDAWLAEAADALGVDRDAMQRDLLLDLTRDVAHGVARPAAPLTAFLVGHGRRQGGWQRRRREGSHRAPSRPCSPRTRRPSRRASSRCPSG